MTDNLQAALDWADQGYFVFPCLPDAKFPATEHGFQDATRDPAQIKTWWTENPAFNIGCAPDRSGMAVLDVDPPLGAQTLAGLELEHDLLPAGFRVTTPRGGLHLWFRGQLRSSVGTATVGLGPKLDTRGTGGYVLLPPSTVTGAPYVIADSRPAAELPDWVCARLASRHATVAASAGIVLDLPGNIERAEQFLRSCVDTGRVAVEGQGGNARTYELAAAVLNLGVSPVRCRELLLDIFNPHCLPPWDPSELGDIVDHAAAYAQNEPGAFAVQPAAEVFDVSALLHDQETPTGPKRFHFRNIDEQNSRPPVEWLIPGLIQRQGIGFVYGDSDSFKTFLALDLCLGLAGQRETFGFTAAEPVETVFIAGEGPHGIEAERRPAWQIARDCSGNIPFFTVDEMPMAIEPSTVDEFIATAKAEGRAPRLVVIDTAFWFSGGLNLNDGRDVSIMMAAAKRLKTGLNCAVMLIHHIGKEDRGMTGSRHLYGAADFVIEVKRHPNSLYVLAQLTKLKDAARRDAPWYFEGRVLGPSLVFQPLTESDYHRATHVEDGLSPKIVGAALRVLSAVGEENSVSRHVLAMELAKGQDEEAAKRIEFALGRLGKTKLEGYVVGARWCLPG